MNISNQINGTCLFFNILRIAISIVCIGTPAYSQITQTFVCNGNSGSYNSGSINTAGTRFDGNILVLSNGIRGWSTFDLSSIPQSSTIVSASINFTTYNSISSVTPHTLYAFVGTPILMSGSSLYAACASGAILNSSQWGFNTNESKPISAEGLSFIGNNLVSNFNLSYVNNTNNFISIYGYNSSTPPTLTITYVLPLPCAGIPTPGNTITTVNPVCLNSNFTLSLENNSISSNTIGTGVTYQWFKDGISIAGATQSIYSEIATSSASYNCSVNCSGSLAFSNSININLSNFINCYCTPTYNTACNGGHHIVNAQILTAVNPINNMSGTCLIPSYSYSDYTSSILPAEISIDDNLPAGSISMSINNGGVFESGGAWIDFNRNAIFESTEFISLIGGYMSSSNTYVYTNPSAINIPLDVTLGMTRIRFRSRTSGAVTANSACGHYPNGETEDYLINLTSLCPVGNPNLGNTTTTVNPVCLNNPFTLSHQSPSAGSTGFSYQWQYSLDSLNWISISGATNPELTLYWTWPESETFFRLYAYCLVNEFYSNPIHLYRAWPTYCYCLAGANVNGCSTGNEYIGNITFSNINNTSNCGTSGQYSNFTSINAFVNKGTSYNASVLIPNWVAGNQATIWIDFNQNGTLTEVGEQFDLTAGGGNGMTPLNGNITIPNTAQLGTTRMRVRCTNGGNMMACGVTPSGEVEDYTITILPPLVTVQLKLFLEGYYIGSAQMSKALYNQGMESNVLTTGTDSVLIELRSIGSPHLLFESYKGVLQSNGILNCTFPSVVSGNNFYIVVKHRNALETWSAAPVAIGANTFYDFTVSSNKAFGNNQIEVENGIWALYSGELNKDENIDLLDLGIVEGDINNFAFGYFDTDINGDGNVDLLDYLIVEGNVNKFVFAIKP